MYTPLTPSFKGNPFIQRHEIFLRTTRSFALLYGEIRSFYLSPGLGSVPGRDRRTESLYLIGLRAVALDAVAHKNEIKAGARGFHFISFMSLCVHVNREHR